MKGKLVVLSHHIGGSLPYNDPARRKWQDPEGILTEIDLEPGFTFADIGCGGGFFALPAARMVGKEGKVYGLDANPASIAALEKQAELEGLQNLFLTSGKAEEIILCQQCADIVFFGLVLHDFQDAFKATENARKTLKPTGKLVNLDWKKESTAFGPPPHIRFDEDKASRIIEKAGFAIESVKNSGLYHYMIIARPVKGK